MSGNLLGRLRRSSKLGISHGVWTGVDRLLALLPNLPEARGQLKRYSSGWSLRKMLSVSVTSEKTGMHLLIRWRHSCHANSFNKSNTLLMFVMVWFAKAEWNSTSSQWTHLEIGGGDNACSFSLSTCSWMRRPKQGGRGTFCSHMWFDVDKTSFVQVCVATPFWNYHCAEWRWPPPEFEAWHAWTYINFHYK